MQGCVLEARSIIVNKRDEFTASVELSVSRLMNAR